MSVLKLDAQPRSLTGRKVRQLRTQGLVPVVVYGNNQPAVNLQVSARNLETTLRHGGFSQLVQVDVQGGGSHNVLVREIQRHPVSHAFVHVDLYAVSMTEKQRTTVQVVSVGKPTAFLTGFTILQEKDAVEVEALPADIPASIEVDVTALELERPITAADLPAIPGVEYLDEPAEILFVMLAPRVQEEEEEVAEAEGMEEPEVVGRGKEDEDEE
ncbi:MAG: 50S ribosomal protein L25 [Caldilineaceae bacterium]|nr:50S ribosomal protein L25 [Caldilineaceae bacterium]